jgi:hypothetical protein
MSVPAPRPTFVVSTLSSPLLRPSEVCAAVRRAGLAGVDLDLTGWRNQRMLTDLAHSDPSRRSLIASVWVPADRGVSRLGRLTPWKPGAVPGASLPRTVELVVVDEEKERGHPNGHGQLRSAIRLRDPGGFPGRIALAVRPRNPEGGRAHLARLSLLKSVAAEWDFDLALDLAGPVDWLWEAEAAIVRMASRLRLVRVLFPLHTPDAHLRARMTQRTLAACVDAGFDGLIAIAVPLPCWRWLDADALERMSAEAVDRLASRFGIEPAGYRRHLAPRSSA